MMTEEQKQALINDLQSEKLVLEKWRDDWNTRDKVNYQAIDIALVALNQPASPALKLPDEMDADHPRMRWVGMDELWGRIQGWNDCLEEVKRLNAPHTAPIEPICTTGGAEWVKVPRKLTAANGAKSALIGEFKEEYSVSCPECFGEEECETCDGSGRIHIEVPVSWTTIKAIWDMGVEHFTAAPEAE